MIYYCTNKHNTYNIGSVYIGVIMCIALLNLSVTSQLGHIFGCIRFTTESLPVQSLPPWQSNLLCLEHNATAIYNNPITPASHTVLNSIGRYYLML